MTMKTLLSTASLALLLSAAAGAAQKIRQTFTEQQRNPPYRHSQPAQLG